MEGNNRKIILPKTGTIFRFNSGDIVFQTCDRCEIIKAELRPNAIGRMGGRIWFLILDSGEKASVTLSYYHEHAGEILIPPNETSEKDT